MKSTLIILVLILSCSSCQFPKEYDCICRITVTTDGATRSAGSVTSMMYDKKRNVQVKCEAEEARYIYTTDHGIYIESYAASCNIE